MTESEIFLGLGLLLGLAVACQILAVAASTAATFALPLAQIGIDGADQLVPVTFLVIVGTVTIYGLIAAPAARYLGLAAR